MTNRRKRNLCRDRTPNRWAMQLVAFALLLGGPAGWALETSVLQTMVIISGDEGRGSGFLVKLGDHVYLVTNAHVVRGNRHLTFKTLNNRELNLGPFEIANEADLVRAEVINPGPALEIVPAVDQALKIGDELIVAGNAEGEGVVREITGKLVGLGPDRVETDAGFVPGNSGSPILQKSTSQVVGVATYVKIPPLFWIEILPRRSKSPLSLNEVRRFGYRLDTVTEWIKPAATNDLATQGLRLAQFDETTAFIYFTAAAGPVILGDNGAAGVPGRENPHQNPSITALVSAIGDYSKKWKAARKPIDSKKYYIILLDKLKTAATNDLAAWKKEDFSGQFLHDFEKLHPERQSLVSWLKRQETKITKSPWPPPDPTAPPVTTAPAAPAPKAAPAPAPAVDPASLNFQLTEHLDRSAEPGYQHWVRFDSTALPASLEFLFWITEKPGGAISIRPLAFNDVRLFTPSNGIYRVSVEYRSPATNRKVSNIVEVRVNDAPVAASAITVATNAAPEFPTDPAVRKLFATNTHWTGEITLVPGLYRGPFKIVLGDLDPADKKTKVPGKVTTPPQTRFETLDIRLQTGSWISDGGLFTEAMIGAYMNSRFEARNSLFNRCDLHKEGAWRIRQYSSKWVFENCVFTETFLHPWRTVDIGAQIQNCTFYDINFNPIIFKEDASKEIRGAWVSLKNCRFIRCTIPESLLIATHECVFEDCQFDNPETALVTRGPVNTTLYVADSKNLPQAGPGRKLEIREHTTVPHPAGATLKYHKIGTTLTFE